MGDMYVNPDNFSPRSPRIEVPAQASQDARRCQFRYDELIEAPDVNYARIVRRRFDLPLRFGIPSTLLERCRMVIRHQIMGITGLVAPFGLYEWRDERGRRWRLVHAIVNMLRIVR